MKNNTNNFIHDYVILLQEIAERAKNSNDGQGDFDAGRRLGLYEALSLLNDQLTVFGIRLSDVGIESFDPERFLIKKTKGE